MDIHHKRGLSNAFAVLIVIFIGFLILFLLYFAVTGKSLQDMIFRGKNYDALYEEGIINPLQNKTFEESVAEFDESFIYFMLVSVRAYNLHEPFFSTDKPKIELDISGETYNAVIKDGKIDIGGEGISEEDIIIYSSKEEFIRMMEDSAYIQESFEEGNSSIEMVASETELASKGYLGLYEEITGESYFS